MDLSQSVVNWLMVVISFPNAGLAYERKRSCSVRLFFCIRKQAFNGSSRIWVKIVRESLENKKVEV